MKEKKEKIILCIIVVILLIIDQITKILFYESRVITSNISNNGYYIIVSIVFLIMILKYISKDNSYIKFGTKVTLCFAMAGTIGNMIDRFWNKNIIVFIKIGNAPSLNLSYIYFIITWIFMAIILSKNSKKFISDSKKERRKNLNDNKKNTNN